MKLAHSFVGKEDAPHLAFLLHGVLGAGHNFRGFIRKLCVERPDYRFVLIDLRYHNDSAPTPEGDKSLPTMEACADDLFELCQVLGVIPDVVIGHSLGGKVALNFARRFTAAPQLQHKATPLQKVQLKQAWALDSDPGPQAAADAHQVVQVLGALKAAPVSFTTRAQALSNLIEQGLSSALSQWLTTSLVREKDKNNASYFRFKFELPQIEALLGDYFQQDLWPFLEAYKKDEAFEADTLKFELLVAENSDRWSGSMKQRAHSLSGSPKIHVHTLKNSGHWVHVDNPEDLLELLKTQLP